MVAAQSQLHPLVTSWAGPMSDAGMATALGVYSHCRAKSTARSRASWKAFVGPVMFGVDVIKILLLPASSSLLLPDISMAFSVQLSPA